MLKSYWFPKAIPRSTLPGADLKSTVKYFLRDDGKKRDIGPQYQKHRGVQGCVFLWAKEN